MPDERRAGETPPTRPSVTQTDPIDVAIARGIAFLRAQQGPSGAWVSMEDFEPRTSAVHLITLRFIDRLNPVEAAATARFLASTQRADGSVPPYPHSTADGADALCATALVWAALVAADVPEARGPCRRARRFIEQHGGVRAVVDALYARGDMTAVSLAMVGLVSPSVLPEPHLAYLLVPGAVDLMLTKMNAGVLEQMIFLAAITRCLRERQSPSSLPQRLVHEAEALAAIDFVEGWLNPNGNNNGTTVQTDQAIATLVALGRTPESPRVGSALSWFDKLKVWDHRGLSLRAFTNENWQTALAVRALLHVGVPRDDRAVVAGLEFLCFSQSRLPMPRANLRREGAHRSGGWGFEVDNLILPDTDDTGTVLSAIGLALQEDDITALPPATRRRVQRAQQAALQNLLDMQSDNGGWAGFVWNLGDKTAPGPMFNRPIPVPRTVLETLRFLTHLPLEVGNPPVEGLTGRVLMGLGRCGLSSSSPEVQRAAVFLQRLQCTDGSFWARWFVGYIAATACVVDGLGACAWDMRAPWVARAIAYLLKQQNDDGGWGETPEAYEHPERRRRSPSMPPLTGIVLSALISALECLAPRGGDDGGAPGATPPADVAAIEEAVRRGIAYVVKTQTAAGDWPNEAWLQIYEPYATYYEYAGDAWTRPLEALGRYQRRRRGTDATLRRRRLDALRRPPVPLPPRAPGTWTSAGLRSQRANADPTADTVVRAVFDADEASALRSLMGALVKNDDPIPAGMPEPARAYFATTSSLPSWADRDRIARGQRLFTAHGWIMAAGLFCSSLPQAYCAADGALVLTQTQGMTRHTRRRILETAQFIFDVCAEGGLDDGGVGIRAAQKVRLMHATVRHLILEAGGFDHAALGLPINQEDLAGTLMTFSVVILDALKTAGVDVNDDDEDAYFHLWRVVGHLMGVDAALLPEDPADGRAQMNAIRDDQWGASPQGRELTEDLMRSMEAYLPIEIGDRLPAALIRFFVPARCAALLELNGGRSLEERLVALEEPVRARLVGALAGRREDHLRRLVEQLSKAIMVGLIDAQREGKHAAFRIPAGLVRGWNLEN